MTDITYAAFGSESGHWYTRDGRLVESVPSADGKRSVKPTIRHARELDLVPSVTTIISQMAAPGLDKWKQRQLLIAAMTLPRIDGESDEARAKRIIEDAAEQGSRAAEEGTRLHAALARYFTDKTLPQEPAHVAAVAAVDKWLAGLGVTEVRAEVGFASPPGFGGTIDLTFRIGPMVGIVDYKSVDDDKLAKWKPYERYGWQLAGYGSGLWATPTDHYWNIAIGRESGNIVVHKWERSDMRDNFNVFDLLLQLWQIRNKYEPNTGGSNEC